jgi:hypothetical protein
VIRKKVYGVVSGKWLLKLGKENHMLGENEQAGFKGNNDNVKYPIEGKKEY